MREERGKKTIKKTKEDRLGEESWRDGRSAPWPAKDNGGRNPDPERGR